jgi:hypothetical protein
MNSPTVHVLVMPMLFPKYDASSSEFGGRMSADYVHSTFLKGYVKMSYPTITRLSSGKATIADPKCFSLFFDDERNLE